MLKNTAAFTPLVDRSFDNNLNPKPGGPQSSNPVDICKPLFFLDTQISLFAGLTISALHSGGKTFWEVLKEKKEFELYKRKLDLNQVEFSYTGSIASNFSHILMRSDESPSNILIREIIIRLRRKEPPT